MPSEVTGGSAHLPPSRSDIPVRSTDERLAGLVLLPIVSTALFYVLPEEWQRLPAVQFVPQALAYLGLAIWALRNDCIIQRLGLLPGGFGVGLRWGLMTGLILGAVNVAVILWLVPFFGGDIGFLRDTPHARLPPALMLPWVIILIAFFVEVNFRGFLLGRLLSLGRTTISAPTIIVPALAIAGSALIFSFDPFMVATFRDLHWIALWDGLIWGLIYLRLGTLYATIIAHAVEVIVMYSIIKYTLS